jgi:glycosyltransferase involved in cell wall biosynthesis
MKVLYVMRNVWGGGAPTRFWMMHRWLAKKGVCVTLLATPDASTSQRFDPDWFPDIEVLPLRFPRTPITDYLFYVKAATMVRTLAEEYDVVHDDFSPISPYSFLWSDAIATVHEVSGNPLRRYGIAGLAPLANQKLYRRMGYKAFVSPSPSTVQALRKLGVHAALIPNGVDTRLFKPTHDRSEKEDVVISMVSRFVSVKGHISFLQVAEHLSRTYTGIQYVLPSAGPLLSRMRNLAAKLGLPIHFPGFMECSEEIASVLGRSDIYVHTALHEGFGISVCEAMSAGLPVVTFDVPGVRDLVVPECGFLVPPGDVDQMAAKVKVLIEDPGLRETMGRHSRERVLKRFTWQKASEQLYELYSHVR